MQKRVTNVYEFVGEGPARWGQATKHFFWLLERNTCVPWTRRLDTRHYQRTCRATANCNRGAAWQSEGQL